ncbi:MAG: coproporphyrinogen III oxidase family protein [Bacteroidales bacterium]|nr:coproporphyrinogen III oxidase family protein [Bacteroidales bacterium]
MIYVHVPFCRSFCTYCGFYSELCSRKETQQVQNRLFGDYAEAICEEIDSRREEISVARSFGAGCPENAPDVSAAPDTLYIGGGTPSVLPLPVLERIVKALGPATYEEFTVEVNPDDVVAGGLEYVAGLRSLGVNRVSMGIQSFDDGILRWMNRRHDAAGAREAFRLLRACGFDNISIDLIFGLSQLSKEGWVATVKEALALRPEHISAYQLSIEEDSALERMVSDGRYSEASDEQCRSQYDTLCRMLADEGYVHYEISNWARPGREAVHNSAYWRRVPYVGLGPGAHSFSPGSAAHTFSPGIGTPSFSPEIRSWNSRELPNYEGTAPCAPLPTSSSGIRFWNTQELPRREAGGRLFHERISGEKLGIPMSGEKV